MFRKDTEKVCVLAFIEKGLVILQRAICSDFVLLLRLAVATMGTLITDDDNDFSSKQEITATIDQESLDGARIEKYVIGPVFNLNFFYSPLEEDMPKLELLGVDWRFESSLDGHVRLPAPQQMTMPAHQQIQK